VSESALTSRVKSVRKLVGDDGVRQVVVKTFHGRGFRWVADIDVLEAGAPDRSALAAGRPPTSPTQMRPMPPPGLHTEALGRDQTVGEVTAAFSTRRLVTLIGPPHIGKTRVALEVLGRPHGGKRDVSFVELHTATSHNDILRLLRQAVGLDRGAATQSGQSEDAVERLLLDQLAHSQTPL